MNSLIETGEGRASEPDFGLVHIPGFTPDEGIAFPLTGEDFVMSCAKVIADRIESTGAPNSGEMLRHIQKDPAGLIQFLIDRGEMRLIVRIAGEISVYSHYMRDRWPRRFAARAKEATRTFDDSSVAWYPSIDGDPTLTQAKVVMAGKNPVVDKPVKRMRRKFGVAGEADPDDLAEEIVNRMLA
jgi:hypothetical protein